MSFEGYIQKLCKNGHYWTADASIYSDDEDNICDVCGEKACWENLVDLTNGHFCDCELGQLAERIPGADPNARSCGYCVGGRIDGHVELEVDTPAQYEECPHCGSSKKAKETTYKIPQGKGEVLNNDD